MRLPRAILFTSLALISACASSLGPDLGLDPGGQSDVAGRAAALVPVLVDAEVKAWANEQPSSLTGEPIGTTAPGFREVYGELEHELARQGAAVIAFSVSFGASSEDHAATQYLADAIASSGIPTLVAPSGNPSPSIYASATVGSVDMQHFVLSDGDGIEQLQFGAVVVDPSATTMPFPIAAHASWLAAGGASEASASAEALAAAQCAQIEWADRNVIVAADADDILQLRSIQGLPQSTKEALDEFAAAVDSDTRALHVPPISAMDLLQGRAAIPDGAVVFISDEALVLPETSATVAWNAPAAVLNARVAGRAMQCGL